MKHASIRLASILATASLAATSLAADRDLSHETARSSPAWVRDGVIYEIFPRAFSARGDLAGVTARLDELQKLGVTILWLMPIHPMGHEKAKGSIGSPYAVRDYEAVNPEYGTKEDLKRLVAEAHRRGLKVILDVVLNHTAWDCALIQQHPDFYKRDAAGRIIPPVPDWSDVAGLDYGNARLREYMIGVLEGWLRQTDLDGFRCDVAGMIPTDFWEQARARLEAVKPGILMLAEANVPELLVKAFDLDYDWPLHSTLTNVLEQGAPATAIRAIWEQERASFPRGALQMRFSDDHDEKRAIARFGERGALAASALVFTLDGVPMLYNGMEVGDTAESTAPALFERLPIFWGIGERRPEFERFYRELLALRRTHPALRSGELAWIRNSDETRIVTYLRRDGGERLLVAVNLSNRPWSGTVEIDGAPGFEDATPAAAARPVTLPALGLEAWEVRVFRSAAK